MRGIWKEEDGVRARVQSLEWGCEGKRIGTWEGLRRWEGEGSEKRVLCKVRRWKEVKEERGWGKMLGGGGGSGS